MVKIDNLTKTRIFNHKRYNLEATYRLKYDAEIIAKSLRRDGGDAKVVELKEPLKLKFGKDTERHKYAIYIWGY